MFICVFAPRTSFSSEVELLDQKLCLFLTFLHDAKFSPKWLNQFTLNQSTRESLIPPNPLQHLVLLRFWSFSNLMGVKHLTLDLCAFLYFWWSCTSFPIFVGYSGFFCELFRLFAHFSNGFSLKCLKEF